MMISPWPPLPPGCPPYATDCCDVYIHEPLYCGKVTAGAVLPLPLVPFTPQPPAALALRLPV